MFKLETNKHGLSGQYELQHKKKFTSDVFNNFTINFEVQYAIKWKLTELSLNRACG